MSRTFLSSLVAVAALAVAGAAFGSSSSRASIHVQPTAVAAGAPVHVYGSVGSCSSGRVMVISKAFPGHAFGEGGLTGHVRPDHTYSIDGHVRSSLRAGTYSVSARCGGGNLGVSGRVRVR
jgi:hypothetical protein